MKTGTVYATRSIGTASGVIHAKTEIAYVSARTYLGERTGEYVVSTPSTWGIALIIDRGPDGFDALDAVDDMTAKAIARGKASGREALRAVLGYDSFRIDGDEDAKALELRPDHDGRDGTTEDPQPKDGCELCAEELEDETDDEDSMSGAA